MEGMEINAKELADGGEHIAQANYSLDNQIRGYLMDMANMLRQQATLVEYYKVRDDSHQKIIKEQADRIAELEGDLKYAKSELALDDKVASLKMKLQQAFKMLQDALLGWENAEKELMKPTPQTKPLSDEEICDIESNCQEIWYDSNENGHCGINVLQFARAIEERILGK